MSELEEIDKAMVKNATQQNKLFDELNDLVNARSAVLSDMGHYQCEVCTTHGTDDEMTNCNECGNTYCDKHCEDNLCGGCACSEGF